MRSWRKVKRSRHEAEKKDQQGQECGPTARGIERGGIENGRDPQESHAEEQESPDVPTFPEEEAQKNERQGKKQRHGAVQPRTQRAENVTAIKLGYRQKIQRSGKQSHPGRSPDRRQQKRCGRNSVAQRAGEKPQQQRGAENKIRLRRVRESWN